MGILSEYKRSIIVILLLLLASPLLGIVIASRIGYREPLDIVAEKLGLEEKAIEWSPLRDYSFPGLPDTIGYIVSGLVGVVIIIGIGLFLSKKIVSGDYEEYS